MCLAISLFHFFLTFITLPTHTSHLSTSFFTLIWFNIKVSLTVDKGNNPLRWITKKLFWVELLINSMFSQQLLIMQIDLINNVSEYRKLLGLFTPSFIIERPHTYLSTWFFFDFIADLIISFMTTLLFEERSSLWEWFLELNALKMHSHDFLDNFLFYLVIF